MVYAQGKELGLGFLVWIRVGIMNILRVGVTFRVGIGSGSALGSALGWVLWVRPHRGYFKTTRRLQCICVCTCVDIISAGGGQRLDLWLHVHKNKNKN